MTTSLSTLMHASLAHLSPQVQTLDAMLSKRSSSLPPEIILLIRGCLVPSITTDLIAQSALALANYEQSLRNLLCTDCVAYNLDIYGPDIWQWEQFSGACACLDIHGLKFTNTSTPAPNPKQFPGARHWLESHLSCIAASLSKSRGVQRTRPSGARSQMTTTIRDVVANVLREFNCQVLYEHPRWDRKDDSDGRGLSNCQNDHVNIVPLTSPEAEAETDASEMSWRTRILLNRVNRDLGLLLRYPDIFPTAVSDSTHSPFTQRLRRSNAPHSLCRHRSRGQSPGSSLPFQFLAALFAACFALPTALATVTLTILCFYSKPRSLRIF